MGRSDEFLALPECDTFSVEVGTGVRLKVLSYALVEPRLPASLTAAERAVALGAWQGLSNKEIAQARQTSERTIANQLRNVFKKLGLSSRRELQGLLPGSSDSVATTLATRPCPLPPARMRPSRYDFEVPPVSMVRRRDGAADADTDADAASHTG